MFVETIFICLTVNMVFIRFPFLESPSLANIETSMNFLKEQGALTNDEHLTLIGHMLAQLPVDVVMGKMLIMATVFNVSHTSSL